MRVSISLTSDCSCSQASKDSSKILNYHSYQEDSRYMTIGWKHGNSWQWLTTSTFESITIRIPITIQVTEK